jgi:hypothetical protein
VTLVPQNYVLIRPVVRQMFIPLRYRPDRLSKLVFGSWSNVRQCLDAHELRIYPEAPTAENSEHQSTLSDLCSDQTSSTCVDHVTTITTCFLFNVCIILSTNHHKLGFVSTSHDTTRRGPTNIRHPRYCSLSPLGTSRLTFLATSPQLSRV